MNLRKKMNEYLISYQYNYADGYGFGYKIILWPTKISSKNTDEIIKLIEDNIEEVNPNVIIINIIRLPI